MLNPRPLVKVRVTYGRAVAVTPTHVLERMRRAGAITAALARCTNGYGTGNGTADGMRGGWWNGLARTNGWGKSSGTSDLRTVPPLGGIAIEPPPIKRFLRFQ